MRIAHLDDLINILHNKSVADVMREGSIAAAS
jgi:hypothetical protein